MSEAYDDGVREVFPVRFDGPKSPRYGKDLRPRPVAADAVHISEVGVPKALPVAELATDLTDLVPDESAIQSSATAESGNPQRDQDQTDSLDPQPSSSETTSTTPGSETQPVIPTVSQPTVTTPTSSSPARTSTNAGTKRSGTTASSAPSVGSVTSSGS